MKDFTITKNKNGVENKIWSIETKNQRYVLKKRCVGRIRADKYNHKKQQLLLSTLYTNGVPVAVPIPLFGKVHKKYMLFPQLDGEPQVIYGNNEIIRIVDLVKSYSTTIITPKIFASLSHFQAKNYLDELIDSINQKNIWITFSEVEEFKCCVSSKENINIVHGDFQLGNVLWEHNKITGLVDWDGCTIGPIELDIAHMYVDLLLLCGDDVAENFLELSQLNLDLHYQLLLFFVCFELIYALANHYKWEAGFFGRSCRLSLTQINEILIQKYNYYKDRREKHGSRDKN